jgi:iron complex outermembrane receptor protein
MMGSYFIGDKTMLPGLRTILLANVAAFAVIAPAQAQQAPAQDETAQAQPGVGSDDIVVTAQKREERLLDVPQSVSVVSAETLANVHAERFADYFTRVPSAAIVESQAGQTRLILRGINTGGVGATVATYVDETPYGSATSLANGAILTPDLDPSDIARVEVLRGPQGTLYGANSLGGLVKYVTVAPSTESISASAEASVEDVSHGETGWSTRASLNLPVSDNIAVRASGYYRKDPGFIDDPHRGTDVNGGDTYGGRASILIRPTDRLTLRATAVLQNLNSDASNTEDADPLTLVPTLGDLEQTRVVGEFSHMRYRVYNGTLSYDFGPVELTSSTSWGNLDQRALQDATGVYGPTLTSIFGQPLGAVIQQNVTQRRFTEEVRLASAKSSIFDWTIGGFYTRERNTIDQSLDGVDFDTGNPVASVTGLAIIHLPTEYREIAGFANGTIHFTRRFDLTFGGRYSHNEQSAVQTTTGPLQGDSAFDASSSDDVFTFSVAPSFKPTDNTTLYARVARGYRPGGPNVLPPSAPGSVPRQFGSDTTTNYEAGIKTELLDRRLSLELTVFDVEWDKIQLLVAVDGFGVNTNGSSARSRGVEFSATAKPAAGLTLGVSGAYVDAQLTADASPLSGGLEGDPLPYTAKFSSTVSADYEHALGGDVNGVIGASWRYNGSRYSAFDPDNGQRRLSPYSQIDGHAGITFGKERYRLDAFVRNLTDSRGIVDVGGTGSAQNGAIAVAVTRPRSIGLSFGAKY